MVNFISFVVVNEYNVVPVFYLVVPTLPELVVTACVITGITSVDIELLRLHTVWCYSETL